jgi:predicted Zn-dependent peptidase
MLLCSLPGWAGTLDRAHIKETVFPSGLRLVVKESRATDLASVQVWIRVGGFLEDPRTSGTAHVIEHLVFKGSASRGPGAIDDEVENLGGMLEAATDKDWSRFSCTIAGRHVGKIVGVVGDALRNPRLKLEDFQAEKPVILEEINQVPLNPQANIARALYQLAYAEHPYKLDVRGTPELINKLDIEAVRTFYKKHYVPANMVVVVVGNVDPVGVERAVRTAFLADQPAAKSTTPLPPNERACAKPQRVEVGTPLGAGFVGIAYPAPGVKDDPEVYAMDLLLTMLEHGGVGRLPRALKETGAVEVSFETRRQPGIMSVIAVTGPNNVEQVESLLRRELDFVASRPIPAAELTFAKRLLHGSYVQDNETYAGQASSLGYYAAIDSWEFAADYLSKVDAITPEQVQAVAKKYLDPAHTVAVLLKPRTVPPVSPPRSGTE